MPRISARAVIAALARARFPLLVAVVYGWLFAWFPALRSPNELARVYQTRAIVTDRTFAVDRELARRGTVGDLAVYRGRHFAAKAPGVSLAGVPVYGALELLRGGGEHVPERAAVFFLRLCTCIVPGVVAAELLRRILLRRFAPDMAWAGATAYALGTIAWPYSTQLVGHGPTAAALVAAWYAIERGRETELRWAWSMAGFAAGSAVLIEYTSAMMLPALLGYVLAVAPRRARAIAMAVAGAAVPLAVLAGFHTAAFGHPLATPYHHLATPLYVQWHSRGLMGIATPEARLLWLSFFDRAKGLFAVSPFLALGVVGLPLLWRIDRSAAALCGVALLVYGVFTAGFSLPAWGWSIGPRHLTPLCAFLTVPAVAFAAWARGRGVGFVAAGAATCSIAVVTLVCVVCPYLPDDLTSPVAQLVLPLAGRGLHVADVLGMALGVRSWWTLLPCAIAVALLVEPTVRALAGGTSPVEALVQTGAATVLAVALWVAVTGGADLAHVEGSRSLLLRAYEPTGATVAGPFAPP